MRSKLACLYAACAWFTAALAVEPLKPHPQAIASIHSPEEVDRPEMMKWIVYANFSKLLTVGLGIEGTLSCFDTCISNL